MKKGYEGDGRLDHSSNQGGNQPREAQRETGSAADSNGNSEIRANTDSILNHSISANSLSSVESIAINDNANNNGDEDDRKAAQNKAAAIHNKEKDLLDAISEDFFGKHFENGKLKIALSYFIYLFIFFDFLGQRGK